MNVAGALAAALVTTAALTARAQAPQPSPYGAMQAGGLVPPPPLPPGATPRSTAGASATERELDEAKTRDAGRGLRWVMITGDGGFEHVGLQALKSSDPALAAGFAKSAAGGVSGAYAGGGLALRLLFLTIGARGQVGLFGPFREVSLGGELGLHLPFGAIEPSLALGAGFASVSGLQGSDGADAGVSMSGLYGRATLGLDYFVAPVFSIGLRGGVDLLALSRGALDAAKSQDLVARGAVTSAQATALSTSGSTLGGSILLGATAGLHF